MPLVNFRPAPGINKEVTDYTGQGKWTDGDMVRFFQGSAQKIKGILEKEPNISPDDLEAKCLGYNVNFDDPTNVTGEQGYFRVNEAATGMMLVKREVFRTMFKKFPERKYETDQLVNGKHYRSDNCYDLFAVGPYMTAGQKRYLSEDYYFSRLWQECGGEIWADLAMPLTHFGNRAYKGHVASLVAKKD